jgi:hypothetical protein
LFARLQDPSTLWTTVANDPRPIRPTRSLAVGGNAT